MSKRIGMVGRYTEDEAREIVDRQARYQENLTYLAAESVRRRLEAAERLAQAAETAHACVAEHIERPHKGDSFEGHWGSDGFGCLDALHRALAAYREASK